MGLSANTVRMSEQGVWGMSKTDFPLSPRQTVPKKYPRAGGGVAPCKQSPSIIYQYAPIATAIRQSKPSTAEAFPLPAFCYAFPVLLFLAFCIDRTGRGNNRIAYTTRRQQRQKQTQRKRASKAQAKRESVTHSNAITKRTRQRETDSTSKRACKRACYYKTSKTDHAIIYTIPL